MNYPDWHSGSCAKECYGFRGPPFPQKLFEAMDSPHTLIQWTNNGRAICVDAEEYERNVMDVHPGLVEISTFPNFRRQMREYGFDWLYHPETREFEFSHPSFLRGRPDLLLNVLTRRKRRRRRGVASFEAPSRTASAPRRRSVIAFAGTTKKHVDDRQRTGSRPSDVGTAKSLGEMTDEEWWKYCMPGIVEGMEGVDDGGLARARCQSTSCKLTTPLHFWCDGDEATSTVSDGTVTRRILDFDEL